MTTRFYTFDDDGEPVCCNPGGHEFVCEEVESGEGRSYCQWCLADGDA